jgi:hypothetical protein
MKTVPSCGSKRRVERGGRVCVRSGCVGPSVCVCGMQRGVVQSGEVWGLEPVFGWMWGNLQPPATHNSKVASAANRADTGRAAEGREEPRDRGTEQETQRTFVALTKKKRPPDEAPKAASAFWTARSAPTRIELNHSFITTGHTLHNFPNHFLQYFRSWGCL